MRLRVTRLIVASLIFGCATLIYLSFGSHARPTTFPYFKTKASSKFVIPDRSQSILAANGPDVEAVRRFWEPFARHMVAAKPTIPPIKIDIAAGNINAPTDGKSFRKPPATYIYLTKGEIDALKEKHTQFRSALESAFNTESGNATAPGTGLFQGEGVVTVAGGEYFGPAIVGIMMLRQTGCNLPVEAFVANYEEYERGLCQEVLPSMNAKCLVLTDFLGTEDGFEVTHYQLKSLAILFSSFRHILYLDSDSIPLVDPATELFAEEPYLSTGLVSWPDFWIGSETPAFYTIAGFEKFPENLPESSTEAGQLLVDKGRHLKTLLLAAYYNIWGPNWYYPLQSQGAMGQGDKNTFETAAIVLAQPWYRVKTMVKALGRNVGQEYKGSGMVQFHPGDDASKFRSDNVSSSTAAPGDEDGSEIKSVRPAFMHANTPKMNAGHLVDEGDLQDPSGNHLRLWGNAEDQVALFGIDLERRAWTALIEVGCRLGHIVKEWKDRQGICGRLETHWNNVFESH